MLKNKKIVVTGGAGFIGSNLVHALAKVDLNNEVVVIDNLSTGRIENIQGLIDNKKIEFIKSSITDLVLLQKIFRGVDFVFHQAAVASVPKSVEDPITTHNVNVTGTLNVLLAARENDVKRVVFSSSCAVYGNPSEEQLPLKETTLPHPLSPYAASKLMGEYYCNVFSEVYDLPTVCLRYFNVYGPRQDPNGEYAAVIPKFINRVKEDKPLTIYGDGKQTRDFVFVDDVVNANILLAESNLSGLESLPKTAGGNEDSPNTYTIKKHQSNIFNVASGKDISINELAASILEMNNELSNEKNIAQNKNIEILYEDFQPGDIRYSSADISKIKMVGFEPRCRLENGLKKTIGYASKATMTNVIPIAKS